MKRIWQICLTLSLAGTTLAGTAPAAGPPGPPARHPALERAIRRQQFRQEKVNLAAFVDTLGITRGMTILDIGAGPGYASFLFAERLQGSGAVYATDIRSDFVDYIAGEAKRRGLGNLSSALVSEKGLDEFYTRHRYDVVFLSNVYHCFDDRVDYFAKLRPSLAPGARLVAILYNQTPLFSDDDFTRYDALVQSLAGETPDSPFARNLSDTTRRLLADPASVAAAKVSLANDFNRMLEDPRFYLNFYRDSYFTRDLFTPAEREFANWLLMSLVEDGVLDDTFDRGDARKMRTVIKLNRLFFVKRFGDFLAQGGLGAYFPVGDANRHTSKYVLLRELDAAGYRFVEEVRLSPYYDAVIMAPKEP